MKPTSTLRTLTVGSLLLASILTACTKDPIPVPTEIYTWDSANPHKPAKIASAAKADNAINTSADSPVDGDTPSSRP